MPSGGASNESNSSGTSGDTHDSVHWTDGD
jgi:hypothetical protein